MHEKVLFQLQHLRGRTINGGLSMAELEKQLQALKDRYALECSESEYSSIRRLVESFWCAMEQDIA